MDMSTTVDINCLPRPAISGLQAPVVVAVLNHWFGQGEARKQAHFDVNLVLAPGKLTMLMGPSGSGKTTLLKLIYCRRNVRSGSVKLLGTELQNAPEHVLVTCRRRLGFIFGLITCMKVSRRCRMSDGPGAGLGGDGQLARRRCALLTMLASATA